MKTTSQPLEKAFLTMLMVVGFFYGSLTATNEKLPIEDNLELSISVQTEVSCFGENDGSVTVVTTGGLLPYTYAWSNAAIDPTNINLEAGVYTCTVTDFSGATATVEVNISQPPVIDLNIDAQVDIDCNNESGSVTLSGQGGTGNLAYVWSNGSIGTTATNLSAGMAFCTVSDENGCTQTLSVMVEENLSLPEVEIDLSGDLQLDCNSPTVSLNANATGNAPLSYLWATTSGHIMGNASTEIIEVDAAGTYELTVINTETGCSSTQTVEVEEDFSLPAIEIAAAAGGDLDISCTELSLTLNETATASSQNLSYLWGTANGRIMGEVTTEVLEVSTGGTYELIVTNNETGCTNTESVEVTADANIPQIDINPVAGANLVLGCNETSVSLESAVSATSSNLSYVWTTTNGQFMGNVFTELVEVNAAGTYELVVTDNEMGCSGMHTVEVTLNQEAPIAEIKADATVNLELDCDNNTIELDASASSNGPDFTSVWTSVNGNVFADINSLTPTVSAAGTYELLITNEINGCTATVNVEVTAAEELPEIEIAEADLILGCNDVMVDLDGSGSATGSNMTYLWTTANGNISANTNTLTTSVEAEGTYYLQVMDTVLNCMSIASVEVTLDTILPTININAENDLQIDCNNTEVTLDVSSNVSNSSFLWTTANGNISGNATTELIEVNAAGTYEIVVTNEENGCTSTETIEVTADLETPTVEINAEGGAEFQLNCQNNTLNLNGNVSGGATNMTSLWTSVDGNIAAGVNDLNATISTAGTYQLLITNEDNGCTSTAEVEVIADANLPIVSIDLDADLELGCTDTNVTLDGEAFANGSDMTFLWTTTNGNFAGITNSSNANVNAAGTYQLQVTNNDNGCTSFATVEVTADLTVPEISLSGTHNLQIDCDNSEVELNASANLGNTTYSWTTLNGSISGNATNPIIEVNSAGTYKVVVKNEDNGCKNTETIEVTTDFDLPEVTLTGNSNLEIDCNNSAIELNASSNIANNTFLWATTNGNISGNVDTEIIEVSAAGTYEVVVTNEENGCTNTETIEVTANLELPEITLTGNADLQIDCNNSEVELNASSNTANNTFLWATVNGSISGNVDTENIEVSAVGTYEVVVTNEENGCTNTETIEVTANLESPEVTLTGNSNLQIDCNNAGVELNAASNVANNTFLWATVNGSISGDVDTENIEVSAAGTYEVVITNEENGCTNIETIEVTTNFESPEITLTSNAELGCNNSAIELNASSNVANNSFLWTTTNGHIIGNVDTENIEVSAAGTYEVVVTNEENGCTNTETIEITTNFETPEITLTSNSNFQFGCDNSEVELNAASNVANNTFFWSTTNGIIVGNVNTANIEAIAEGTYQVMVTNGENGCTNTETVEVTTNTEVPEITLTGNADLQIDCDNSAIELTASSNVSNNSYLWSTANGNISGSANSELIEVTAEGTYEVVVTNNYTGCSNTETIEVTSNFEAPAVEINGDISGGFQLDCTNSTLTLSGNVSGGVTNISSVWTSLDGNIVAGVNDLNSTISAAGTYQLLITNEENGCTATAEVEVMADANLPTIEIDTDQNLEIGCEETSVVLDGSASIEGANISYLWTTVDGNIEAGANTNMATANAAGVYQLQVTNNDNGCTSLGSVEVTANLESPEISVEGTADFQIDCNNSEVELTASSNLENTSFLWATANGNISGTANTEMIEATAEGTYEVIITNEENGCTSSETVEVTADLAAPTVEISSGILGDLQIDCLNNTLILNGSVSTGGAAYSSVWSSANGNIVASINDLAATVSTAGTYELLITNEENGCSSSASIEVTADASLPTVEIDLEADLELNCDNSNVTLDGSASVEGSNISYLWTTVDGNIETGLNSNMATANAAGVYQLQVTNNDNGCTSIASVEVTANMESPEVSVEGTADLQIDCNNSEVELTASSNLENTSILWTTANGNISGTANTEMIEVTAEGTYEVMVTNLENGCTSTESIEVSLDNEIPTASAGATAQLTCDQMTLALDGSASSQGANFSYEWLTISGNIIMNGNTATPIIDTEGTYQIIVTNNENGCTAAAETTVSSNISLPEVSIVAESNLDCENPTVMLDATASATGANHAYSWTTLNGNIVAGINSLTPEVNAAGVYTFSVVNHDTGCAASASIEITLEMESPLADVGINSQLDCNNNSIELGGTATSQGNNFTHQWLTSNGNIVANANTPNATVNAAGDYTLIVTNENNGCTAESSISVTADMELPVAEAVVTGMIGCENSTILIDASASSVGTDFTYEWTTSTGVIASGSTTLSPIVNAAGTYNLVVTNNNSGCTAEVEVMVEGSTDLELSLDNLVNASCSAAADGSLAVEVSGGTGNITYQWSNGINTPSNSGLVAGSYGITITDEGGCVATALFEVEAPAPLEFELNASSETAVNANNGSATINVTGGTAPYTFMWNNGFTAQTVFNLPPNMYSVIVVDAAGCQIEVPVVIEEFDDCALSLEINTTNAECGNPTGEISLIVSNANGTISYNWENGLTTSSINNLEAGIYTFVVIDELGCEITAEAEILDEDTTPPVALTQNVELELDADGNAAITAEMINNGSFDNCSELDIETSFDLSVQQFDCINVGENMVMLTVTDDNGNSSSAEAMVTIVDNTPPVALTQNIELELDADGNAVLTAEMINNGSFDNCGELNIETNFDLSVQQFDCTNMGENMVMMTVTDDNGNSASAEAMVTIVDNTPPVVLTQNIELALDADGNAVLTAEMINNGSFDNCSELDIELNFDLNVQQFDCTTVGENTVMITVTDENGNSASAEVTVTVVDETPAMINCPSDMEVNTCGGQINYEVPTLIDNCESSAANFTLVSGLASGSIFPMGVTTITYVGITSNGQISECTFEINVTGEGLETEISMIPPSCPGEFDGMATATVTGGTGNYSYLWVNANSQTTATATGLGAGSYMLIVSDDTGCSFMTTVEIEDVNPINVDLIFLEDNCEGEGSIDITVSGGTSPYTFVWLDAEGNIIGETEDLENVPSGTYDVQVTDANGCFGTFVGIEVDFINGIVNFIKDLGEMTLMPNPTNGFSELNVELTQSSTIRVEVMNVMGQHAISPMVEVAQNHTFDVDLTGLPSGNYLVRVMVDGHFFRQELLSLNN